jgi:hypothetical protein
MSETSFIVGSPITPAPAPSAPPAENVGTPAQEPTSAPAAAPASAPRSLALTQTADRPAWLPPEYKTMEDLAKAHQELRAKMSGKADDKVLVTEQDLQGYMQEVVGSGSLSDGSRRALRAKGLTDGLIDQHVAGLQAIRDGQMNRFMTLAGGAEKYKAMSEWAGATLPAADQASYNAAVNSGNPEIVAMAVQGLKARYELSGGGQTAPTERAAPTRLSGGAPAGATGVRMFASMAEQVRAQADPRYNSDPAFRATVEKMIDASIKAGKY